MKELVNVSIDQKVISALTSIANLFGELNAEYLIFGSCGLQSYLRGFYRLPNDIDIIIRKKDIVNLISLCQEKKYLVEQELGRIKLFVNKFPIHVIPEEFSVVNKADNSIFTKIDFSDSFLDFSYNVVKLQGTNDVVSINALSLEESIFLQLIGAFNTNSLMTVFFVFSCLNIDNSKFVSVTKRNVSLLEVIIKRLGEYHEKIITMQCYPNLNVKLVTERISNLQALLKS